ncbi:MAG TPA: IPT/TIG domain-containing protein [Bryobacteraceae bacterium]|nr:IPT/TIG domain-containing protein [Bryobacteraceae bacterium]
MDNYARKYYWKILCLLVAIVPAFAAPGNAPQIGGGSCAPAILNGTYYYLLTGTMGTAGGGIPYAELGQLVANGNGGLSGSSSSNLNGPTKANLLTGSYTLQANCSGSMTLKINSQTTTALTIQVTNNGQGIILSVSNPGEIVSGRAYRTSAMSGSPACGQGSLSGAYGYRLTGYASTSGMNYLYSDAGQIVADGNGSFTASSVTNLGGAFSNTNGTGSYSITAQCSGTATISHPGSTASNYSIAVVEDGQQILFLETDSGTTVTGAGQPQFVAPQQAAVNAASYRSGMIAPGGLFSIFGTGLSSETAAASSLPLSTNLGQTQLLVNGVAAPLVYVSSGQINAQMPVNVQTGTPVTLTVMNGLTASNQVTLSLPAAAPGIFTTNGTQAIVQNASGALNSSATPAHPGETLVVYLTGGGAVNSHSWTTGAASPSTPARVTSPYTLTFGTQPALVQFVGLTPGFVGLYQANFTVPPLAPGTYPLVITMAGNASNAANVVVGG